MTELVADDVREGNIARAAGLERWLTATITGLVERPGVLGAHYLEGDAVASRTETEEKRLRSVADAMANRVLLVGRYDADALHELRRTVLAPAALVAQGAADAQPTAVYRLLHCITEADLGA